jgi:hypothetical protein
MAIAVPTPMILLPRKLYPFRKKTHSKALLSSNIQFPF